MAIVRIELKSSISLEKFDVMQQLGRFTLRDEGKTIGMGKVTKLKQTFKNKKQITYDE